VLPIHLTITRADTCVYLRSFLTCAAAAKYVELTPCGNARLKRGRLLLDGPSRFRLATQFERNELSVIIRGLSLSLSLSLDEENLHHRRTAEGAVYIIKKEERRSPTVCSLSLSLSLSARVDRWQTHKIIQELTFLLIFFLVEAVGWIGMQEKNAKKSLTKKSP
jgi:hypothetical protein